MKKQIVSETPMMLAGVACADDAQLAQNIASKCADSKFWLKLT